MGLWALAGSWATGEGTDGFVPRELLLELGATTDEVDDLVAAGLWRVVDGGWRFTEWSPHQFTAGQIQAEREANRARQAALRKATREARGDTAPKPPRVDPAQTAIDFVAARRRGELTHDVSGVTAVLRGRE
jgi:hypothetical protein